MIIFSAFTVSRSQRLVPTPVRSWILTSEMYPTYVVRSLDETCAHLAITHSAISALSSWFSSHHLSLSLSPPREIGLVIDYPARYLVIAPPETSLPHTAVMTGTLTWSQRVPVWDLHIWYHGNESNQHLTCMSPVDYFFLETLFTSGLCWMKLLLVNLSACRQTRV
jgi:hypothetical protein